MFKMKVIINSHNNIPNSFWSKYIYNGIYNPSSQNYGTSFSHTTYAVCVNIFHEWQNLEFLSQFRMTDYLINFSWQFYFILRVFARKLLRKADIRSGARIYPRPRILTTMIFWERICRKELFWLDTQVTLQLLLRPGIQKSHSELLLFTNRHFPLHVDISIGNKVIRTKCSFRYLGINCIPG